MEIVIATRICRACKIDKEITEFGLRTEKDRLVDPSRRYWQCNSCKVETAAIWNKKNHIRRLSTHAKQRAKKHGLACTIDYQWVLANLPTNCPCCKKEFDLSPPNGRGRRDRKPSLDRFDPEQGYTKENTKIICARCNMIKSDGTAEEHDNVSVYMRNEPIYAY